MSDDPEFVKGTVQAPPDVKETAPKRRGGWPKGKPRGRVTSRPRSISSAPRVARNIQVEVAGVLGLINFGIMMLAPKDALDAIEISALAAAIADEAKRNARFAKIVEAAMGAAGGAGLIGVIAIIGARRAARHEIIPGGQDIDNALGNILAMSQNVNAAVA
jgi:hypothetical protein